MRLVLLPEARLEFEEAERYYNRQLGGLDDNLLALLPHDLCGAFILRT